MRTRLDRPPSLENGRSALMQILVRPENSLGRLSNLCRRRARRPLRLLYEKYLYGEAALVRTHGTAGRVPPRLVRRVLGDPGDGLRPVVRPASGAAVPPAQRGVSVVPRARGLGPPVGRGGAGA